jgi:hypothetical protein
MNIPELEGTLSELGHEAIRKVAYSLIGTPYNTKDAPNLHSPEIGFNCYTWWAYLYQLSGRYIGELPDQLKLIRYLRNNFVEVKDDICRPLDIPMFYFSDLGTRHFGVMLDKVYFTHCSASTNGVAVSQLAHSPWSNILRKVYRYR